MTDVKAKISGWRKWLLIGSVALNLAIIGLVVGFVLREPRGDTGRPTPPDILRELVRAVPGDHRDALRSDLRAKRDDMRGFREEIQNQRLALVQTLESPNFDMTSISTLFEENRITLSRITTSGHDIIVRRIEQMSDADRKAFAENLRTLYENRRSRDKAKRY